MCQCAQDLQLAGESLQLFGLMCVLPVLVLLLLVAAAVVIAVAVAVAVVVVVVAAAVAVAVAVAVVAPSPLVSLAVTPGLQQRAGAERAEAVQAVRRRIR